MPPLPRNNSRSGKAAKRVLESAARAVVEGDNRKTRIANTSHLAYDPNFHDQARHLSPRARKAMGLDAYPTL